MRPRFVGGVATLLLVIIVLVLVGSAGVAAVVTVAGGVVALLELSREIRRGSTWASTKVRRRKWKDGVAPGEFRLTGWEPATAVWVGDLGYTEDHPDGMDTARVVVSEVPSTFGLPPELAELRNSGIGSELFNGLTDGTVCRLETLRILREPVSERPLWELAVSQLSYFDFLLDSVIGSRGAPVSSSISLVPLEDILSGRRASTFWEVMQGGSFARGITVHLNVIDATGSLLYARRPTSARVYPGALATSATGTFNWNHRLADSAAPSPFVAGASELVEETGIKVSPGDIQFLAIVMQEDQKHPLLIGEVILPSSFEQAGFLRGGVKDAYETDRFGVLALDDLKGAKKLLIQEKRIPASAVAVALALVRRHSTPVIEAAFGPFTARLPWSKQCG